MCGRYTLHRPKAELIKAVQPELWPSKDEYQPRYNIAPGTSCLALTLDHGDRNLDLMHWGLSPAWGGARPSA